MRHAEDIRELMNKAEARTTQRVDERILGDALKGLGEVKKNRPAMTGRNVWRKIMVSRILKFAAAIVIVAAILLGVKFTGGPDMAGVALADVQTAFLAQSWVHLEYDNGTESWDNLTTGDHGSVQLRDYGKSFYYIDRAKNLRQCRDSNREYITEDIPTIYRDGVIPTYEPKTAWDTIVGHLEKIAEDGASEYWDVKIRTDISDSNNAVRFDVYFIDALGRELLTEQLWADPQTRLPLRIRKRLTSQEQKDQGREYITGVFSFPQDGPHSIYDLGVPENLPVTKDYERVAEPAIEEIIETAKRYCEDFPKRCRGVIWQNDRKGEIDITWRDGEKVHHNRYFNMDEQEYHLEVPATVEDVLAWARTEPPVTIGIDDGKRNYDRTHHPAVESLRTPKVSVTRSIFEQLSWPARFIERQWDYTRHGARRFEFIDEASEGMSEYIGLRIEGPDFRGDYYIDPEHDYIEVAEIWWKLRDGQWQKRSEDICEEMAQLPGGQWYVTKRKEIRYEKHERRTRTSEYNYTIDITLLEADEFPPDTFNGEKLLEGAELETY